jgi:alpha-beta hydrolase superfamily lysophospholipase
MAHGLGDHLGCHVVAAEMFCGHGWLCAGVDWPGHGFSEGKRGHIDGVGAAIRMIAESCRFLREQIGPDAPLGFYAHSTGALFGLHFLELNQQGSFGDPTLFDRIWLGSPLLRPQHGQHPVKVWGAGLIGKLAPGLIFDTHVRPERCRRIDPEKAKAKGDYDLCHHYVSAALGADMLRYGRRTERTAHVLGDPSRILITQGADDRICPAEFSRGFFEKIPACRKTYALLSEMFHEPLREPDNTAVIEAVDQWMTD